MSHRAVVGVTNLKWEVDNSITYVYLHHGGPDWSGKLLLEHFNYKARAENLVIMGDLFCLGEDLAKVQAYCQDRGKDWESVKPFTCKQEEFSKIESGHYEFVYIFDDGKWRFGELDWRSRLRIPKRELTAEIVETYWDNQGSYLFD